MLNLFNRKLSPDRLIQQLQDPYSEIIAVINWIDGPFVNLYECGIFVSAIVTSKILTFQSVDPPAFADRFNVSWVEYIVNSYDVDGIAPSKKEVIGQLQEKFSVYRKLFFDTIDESNKDKLHDNAVQLTWELFSNCTGKRKPERKEGFINLTLASSEIVSIGLKILNTVHE